MTILYGTRPEPTPESEHFWSGTRAGKLLLQRCETCSDAYFPPRPFCPRCGSRSVQVFEASGKGSLYSYTIDQVSSVEGPFAVAVVALEEGPRLATNIIGVDQTPEALVLDMPLEVVFQRLDDTITLPRFAPAGSSLETNP